MAKVKAMRMAGLGREAARLAQTCQSMINHQNTSEKTLSDIRQNEWKDVGDTIEKIAVVTVMPLLAGGGVIITTALGAGAAVSFRAMTDGNASGMDYVESALNGMQAAGLYTIGTSVTSAGLNMLRPDRAVTVSRWGGIAGQPGSWAMSGRPTLGNYIGSGKWDFISRSNQFAAPWNVTTTQVPASWISIPSGFGRDGFIKWVLAGQRKILY